MSPQRYQLEGKECRKHWWFTVCTKPKKVHRCAYRLQSGFAEETDNRSSESLAWKVWFGLLDSLVYLINFYCRSNTNIQNTHMNKNILALKNLYFNKLETWIHYILELYKIRVRYMKNFYKSVRKRSTTRHHTATDVHGSSEWSGIISYSY